MRSSLTSWVHRSNTCSDPLTHQARLNQYVEKVRKAVRTHELATSRRTLEMDVAAVNRFISHAVSDKDVKRKLQQPSSEKWQPGADDTPASTIPMDKQTFLQETLSSIAQE